MATNYFTIHKTPSSNRCHLMRSSFATLSYEVIIDMSMLETVKQCCIVWYPKNPQGNDLYSLNYPKPRQYCKYHICTHRGITYTWNKHCCCIMLHNNVCFHLAVHQLQAMSIHHRRKTLSRDRAFTPTDCTAKYLSKQNCSKLCKHLMPPDIYYQIEWDPICPWGTRDAKSLSIAPPLRSLHRAEPTLTTVHTGSIKTLTSQLALWLLRS